MLLLLVELSDEGLEREVGEGRDGIEGNCETIDCIPGELSEIVIFPGVTVVPPVVESEVVAEGGEGASVVTGLGKIEVLLFPAFVKTITEMEGNVVTDWIMVIDGIPLASTEVTVRIGIVAVGPGIKEVSPTKVDDPITIEGSGKGEGLSETVSTVVVLELTAGALELTGAGVIIGAGIAEMELLDATTLVVTLLSLELLGCTIGIGNKLCKTPTILWASEAIELLAAWAAGSVWGEAEVVEEKIPDAIESEVEDCEEVEAGVMTVAFWVEETGEGEGVGSRIVWVESTTDDDRVEESVEEEEVDIDWEVLEVEFVEMTLVLFEAFPFPSLSPSLLPSPSVESAEAEDDGLVELGERTTEEDEEVEATVEFTVLEVAFEFVLVVAFLTAETSLWTKWEVVASWK